MPRFALVIISLLCCVACQERVATTPEEQQLLQRLTRDPSIIIAAMERDDDGRLLVSTRQGDGRVAYIFKPDVPGEKTLNIHRIDSTARLDEGTVPPPPPWRAR